MERNVIVEYQWSNPTSRTYHYPDGNIKTFHNLVSLKVMVTGCHVLKTKTNVDGQIYIVAPGWLWIEQWYN